MSGSLSQRLSGWLTSELRGILWLDRIASFDMKSNAIQSREGSVFAARELEDDGRVADNASTTFFSLVFQRTTDQ